MTPQQYNVIVKTNISPIRNLAKKIHIRNSDYSISTIISMIKTEIWESEKFNSRHIYIAVLNRILEERGYKYLNGKSVNIFSSINEEISPAAPEYIDNNKLVQLILEKSELSQEEVFVITLSFGLSSSSLLNEEHQKIIDEMEQLYYCRPLTLLEISKIVNQPIIKVRQIRDKALEKLWKTTLVKTTS